MCTPIVRGTVEWTAVRQPSIAVQEAGTYRLTVAAYGKPSGTAWFDEISLTEQLKRPLEAFLLYPNFRGMLFDDRPQTVRVALTTRKGGAPTPGTRVRLSLVEEAHQRTVVQRDLPVTASQVGELDTAALPAGQYLLRAELVDASGTAQYRYTDYRIVKTPAKARDKLRVWYDERNVTYLDGKPVFVLGLYNTSGFSNNRSAYATGHDGWGNDRIAQAPINMLINYWLGVAPVSALTAYMDDLYARGIHYLHTVNFYYEDHPQYKTIPYPAARDGEDALNRWVAGTLAQHPGLAGFYTADERPADVVPKVFRQHRELRRAAPGTVDYVVLGDGWEKQAPLWRDAMDVMGLDPYPITRKAGENHLAMVGEWTRLGQDAVMGSRPLWMVMQWFQLTSAGGWPSYEDLHAMSWMAIVEGARGLLYWSFGTKGLAWVKDPKLREQRWSDLVRVTKQIKALEPVLLAPDAALVTRESSNGVIRTLAKQMPDGRRYLFAYNSGKTPASVTWTLSSPIAETTDLDRGAPGPRPDHGTTLTVQFAPYEVKRLQLR
jgi:hypothetical protein